MYHGPTSVHHFTYLFSSKLEQGSTLQGRTSIAPILQMRTLSFTEIKSLAQGHTASKADAFKPKLSSDSLVHAPSTELCCLLHGLIQRTAVADSLINTCGSAFFLSSEHAPLGVSRRMSHISPPSHTQYIYNPTLHSSHGTQLSFETSHEILLMLLLLAAQACTASQNSSDLFIFLHLKIKPQFPNMVVDACPDGSLACLTCLSLPCFRHRPSFLCLAMVLLLAMVLPQNYCVCCPFRLRQRPARPPLIGHCS